MIDIKRKTLQKFSYIFIFIHIIIAILYFTVPISANNGKTYSRQCDVVQKYNKSAVIGSRSPELIIRNIFICKDEKHVTYSMTVSDSTYYDYGVGNTVYFDFKSPEIQLGFVCFFIDIVIFSAIFVTLMFYFCSLVFGHLSRVFSD